MVHFAAIYHPSGKAGRLLFDYPHAPGFFEPRFLCPSVHHFRRSHIPAARLTREFDLAGPFSLRDTVHVLRMGMNDPTTLLSRNQFAFAQHTPIGPVEVELTQPELGVAKITARCWGPGGEWIVERLPTMLGFDDDPTAFQPSGPLRRLHQKHIGMRMTQMPLVASQVTKVVLMQLVAWRDAQSSWCQLAKRLGLESPGPNGLRLPPRLTDIRSLAQFEMIECGIIPKLARTLKNVAAAERHLEHAAANGPEAFATCMHKIHGIGEWTTQYLSLIHI